MEKERTDEDISKLSHLSCDNAMNQMGFLVV